MDPTATARVALSLVRAVSRWERPDRLWASLAVTASLGPSIAGAVAGATARDPRRLAVIDENEHLSYGQLWIEAQVLARHLDAAGVSETSTVGLLASNSSRFVVGMVATSILGADVVLMNTGFAAPQLADVTLRESCTHLLIDDAHRSVGVDAVAIVERDTGRPSRTYGGGPPVVVDLDVAERDGPTGARGRAGSIRPSRRPARLTILTSGTTGTPKGAGRGGPGTGGLGIFDAVPIRSGDRVLIACPLFHAWGLSHLVIGLTLGSTLIVPASFDPQHMAVTVAGSNVTPNAMVVVPAVLRRVVLAGVWGVGGSSADLDRLGYIASSGSALAPSLVRATLAMFGPVLYNVYGSTEVALATVASPQDLERYPSTAGHPVIGSRVLIVDDDDREVPMGDIGRVLVDSGNAFDGYTGGGDKRRMGSFVDSGDVGHFGETGLLFIDGRSDDMIVSGGENVFPAEVEDFIAELDEVVDVAVVGIDDEEFGQRLGAAVVLHPDVSSSDRDQIAVRITEAVRAGLSRFKVPRDIVVVDAVPRTTTGKIRRPEVVEIVASSRVSTR